MQRPNSRQHVRLVIHKLHGHLPRTITMHSIFRLTAGSTMDNGLYAVNVIQVRQIMQFLIACFAMPTAIKHLSIHNTMAEVDMFTIALIVTRVIREELLINTKWAICSQN